MRMRSLMTQALSRNPSSVLKCPLDQHHLGCISLGIKKKQDSNGGRYISFVCKDKAIGDFHFIVEIGELLFCETLVKLAIVREV